MWTSYARLSMGNKLPPHRLLRLDKFTPVLPFRFEGDCEDSRIRDRFLQISTPVGALSLLDALLRSFLQVSDQWFPAKKVLLFVARFRSSDSFFSLRECQISLLSPKVPQAGL